MRRPPERARRIRAGVQIAFGTALAVWVVVTAIFGVSGYLNRRDLARQVRTLETQIKNIREDNSRMVSEIHRLRSDPVYIERIAREELGMIKPGEIVYRRPKDREPAKP